MGATIVISLNFTPTASRGSSSGTPPCWPPCPRRGPPGPPIPWKCCGAAAVRWWQAVDHLASPRFLDTCNLHPPKKSIPSGKQPHSYGKWQFLMGRITISMAIFNSYVTNYQRVNKQIQSTQMLIHWFPIEHLWWCRRYFGLFAFGHRHFLRGIRGGADRLLRRLSRRSESGLNAPKKPQILAILGSQCI